MIMRVTEDLNKNVRKCSLNYKTHNMTFAAVIVNITKISGYPNT